jgi:hypothetical protein
MCDYCLLAMSVLAKMKTILQKYGCSLRPYLLNVEDSKLLEFTIRHGDATLSRQCKDELLPHANLLTFAREHKFQHREQRLSYNTNVQDPGDFIIVTLDFKEKGVLPRQRTSPSHEFFEQGKYSVLGATLHWWHGVSPQTRFVDLILPTINQDSAVVILLTPHILAELPTCKCCSKKQVVIWADAGRHFLCQTTVSYWLQNPRVKELNFFCAKHGKNHCDGHFGSLTQALDRHLEHSDIADLETVRDVFNTINQTTAKIVPLPGCTLPPMAVFKIPNILSISAFRKNAGTITVAPFTSSEQYYVKHWKSETKCLVFVAKASEKLPGIKKLDGEFVFERNSPCIVEYRESVSAKALRSREERFVKVWEQMKDDPDPLPQEGGDTGAGDDTETEESEEEDCSEEEEESAEIHPSPKRRKA